VFAGASAVLLGLAYGLCLVSGLRHAELPDIRRAGTTGTRRGALNAVWRKCGKPNCACAQPGHRGHGPQRNLTRRIGGKTVNVHLRPRPELEKARREVAEHQRFAALVEDPKATPRRWRRDLRGCRGVECVLSYIAPGSESAGGGFDTRTRRLGDA
jgi:hypothetical protein